MKALIIEIHKDHCIALTPDGRFVKQPIDPGDFEVGDEMTIEERKPVQQTSWFKGLAIAAAVIIVLGLGAWGMLRIFDTYSLGKDQEVATAERSVSQDKDMMMALEEEATPEEPQATAEVEENVAGMQEIEGFPKGPGSIDLSFDIDLELVGGPHEIIAGDFLFTYQVADDDLLVAIEFLDPEISFNGDIHLALLDQQGMVISGLDLELDAFEAGKTLNSSIPLSEGSRILNIYVRGLSE